MNKEFYVYLYWRLDTNEVFYVGKGKGDRWRRLDRKYNPHFMNIVNKYLIAVEIFKDNLTEQEALDIECWVINELVFEYGFSIDIPNNRSSEKGCYLVNMTWGGEGTSGVNAFENKTEEEMKEIKRKISENREYKKRGDHESAKWVVCLNTHEIFTSHISAQEKYSAYDISLVLKGKRNSSGKFPDGTRLYWASFKDYIKLKKENIENIIEKGEEKYKNKQTSLRNPSAKSVICLTTLKVFFTAKEGAVYYNCDASEIGKCCKHKRDYCKNLKWMYVKDFLEKCKYILL